MYDVIIIGGSYAGLSAAMALGRSLRNVLILDSGLPCNRFTPHSHNLITHDGDEPSAIREKALKQVLAYPTVRIETGVAVTIRGQNNAFEVTTGASKVYRAKKLLIATGLKDILPDIPGFKECWGKTLIHCPYCHGYEVRGVPTAVIANGEQALEYAMMLKHWAPKLTLCTNRLSTIPQEHVEKLLANEISIIETPIAGLKHIDGKLEAVIFEDDMELVVEATYSHFPTEQHSSLAKSIGCAFTEMNRVQIDILGQTTVPGVYAAGDATTMFRSLAVAISGGNIAGAAINRQLITEAYT